MSRQSAECGPVGTRSWRRLPWRQFSFVVSLVIWTYPSGFSWRRTCFWAGDAFAPKLKIKVGDREVPVQRFLQDAFLDMFEVLARALGDLEGVIGFEV